jgi:hypothetical protein
MWPKIVSLVGRTISGSSSGRPGEALLALLELECGDDGALHREALDVLGLLREEALGDEQREVGVDVAGRLEAAVEVALDRLPDGVALGRMTMHPRTGA